MPMWLEYIGSSCQGKKGNKVIVRPWVTIIGGIFFSLMWFIIYSFMVVTAYLIYTQPKSVWQTGQLQAFFALFIINMIFNKWWSPVFFGEYRYFSWSVDMEGNETSVTFTGPANGTTKEKLSHFIIKKWNMPTIIRVVFASIIAFLIAATTIAMLGLIADLVAINVITDTAIKVVSLLGLSIYTVWSLLAMAMTTVIGCCIYAKDHELKELKPASIVQVI